MQLLRWWSGFSLLSFFFPTSACATQAAQQVPVPVAGTMEQPREQPRVALRVSVEEPRPEEPVGFSAAPSLMRSDFNFASSVFGVRVSSAHRISLARPHLWLDGHAAPLDAQ